MAVKFFTGLASTVVSSPSTDFRLSEISTVPSPDLTAGYRTSAVTSDSPTDDTRITVDKSIYVPTSDQTDYSKAARETIGSEQTFVKTLSSTGKLPGKSPTSIGSSNEPSVTSQESDICPFETLFDGFDFEVRPVYNFWTEDESSNDTMLRGEARLEDLPRYVRLLWNAAPDLKQRAYVSVDPSKRNSLISSKITSDGNSYSFTVGGHSYSLRHMKDMKLVRGSLANGFIHPGILISSVQFSEDFSSDNGNLLPNSRNSFIDVETFMTHPDTEGLSIQELQSNYKVAENSLVGSRMAAAAEYSTSGESSAEQISSQISLQRNSSYVKITSPAASSPALSMMAAVAARSEPYSNISTLAESLSVAPAADDKSSLDTVVTKKVTFVDTSIGGLVGIDKVNSMFAPDHADSTFSLGQFLPNLHVVSRTRNTRLRNEIDIPSFPTPYGMEGIEYVGYHIEKYAQNADGNFILVEDIDIYNREVDEYVDTKVAYGKSYRYRMRAILRWTRPVTQGVLGLRTDEYNVVNQIDLQQESFANSSYFSTHWSSNWGYCLLIDVVPPPPPDEITVRPESHKNRIVVTMKFPEDIQRDILAMKLYRRKLDKNGNEIEGWKKIGQDFMAGNVIYYDYDVENFQSNNQYYCYAGQTVSKHAEISVLSDQLAARINQMWKNNGEYETKFISQQGVLLENHGAFSTIPFRRSISDPIYEGDISFSLKSGFFRSARFPQVYVVRLQSLTTGEIKDIKFVNNYKMDNPLILNANSSNSLNRGMKIDENDKLFKDNQTVIELENGHWPSDPKDINVK